MKRDYITIQDFIDELSKLDTSLPLNTIGSGTEMGIACFTVHYGKHYRGDEEEKTYWIAEMKEG